MMVWQKKVTLLLTALLLLAFGWAKGFYRAVAQVPTFNVRVLPFPANDLVYHAPSQTLYASVPSRAGTLGNRLVALNPLTGAVVNSIFIGSEPNRLALADDGRTLYVTLDGAAAVRRFDLASQMPGAQFTLGLTLNNELYYAEDIAVMPGKPETLAVVRKTRLGAESANVAIFDNGVARAKTISTSNGGPAIEFSANGAVLYSFDNGYFSGPVFRKLTVEMDGLTLAATYTDVMQGQGNGTEFKFDRGLIYASTGRVINPQTGQRTGDFANVGSGAVIAPDSNTGRVYFLTGQSEIRTLRAFDQNTFVQLGALDLLNITTRFDTQVGSLVRWGSNGMAFRTSERVILVQTLLVPSSDPIPVPSPTPAPTPTPTPLAANVSTLAYATNDLLYDQARRVIYASLPSSAGSVGNRIVTIEPATGVFSAPLWVGSEPGNLALADDGKTLYVGLDGAGSVRRVELATKTAGAQFYLGHEDLAGPVSANDIAIAPGKPDLVAVARYRSGSFAPRFAGVAIFDKGVL
jgi:DNA-binding beta-propeller fold protein YncE